jgi:hypothetical protein
MKSEHSDSVEKKDVPEKEDLISYFDRYRAEYPYSGKSPLVTSLNISKFKISNFKFCLAPERIRKNRELDLWRIKANRKKCKIN